MTSRLAFVVSLMLLFNSALQAQIPRLLSYQGVLTDSSGVPKPDSTYSMTFRLYPVSSGGSEKWTETKSVQLKGGLFATNLGDMTSFPDSLSFNMQYWLGLQIGNATEMSPRIRLTSAPYSLRSINAETAKVAMGAVGNWQSTGNVVYYNNGLVGIGTASPTAQLEVRDTLSNHFGIYANSWLGTAVEASSSGPTNYTIHARNAFGGGAIAGDAGGIFGFPSGIGLRGGSGNNYAVAGFSDTVGVYGDALHTSSPGFGVIGVSRSGSSSAAGVLGRNTAGTGVLGVTTSANFNASGVIGRATASSGQTVGVFGESVTSSLGTGVVGKGSATGGYFEASNADGWAGVFNGRVSLNVLQINGGSDLAEPFETDLKDAPEPGTLLSIDAENPGKLRVCDQEYDTRVAGIISGAGDIRPGITLQQDGLTGGNSLVAIAGRVYCKAEAYSGTIQPGDLLTTSRLPGHAMKASDERRSHGAVIGKAMTTLKTGTGLVLVLVNLQ